MLERYEGRSEGILWKVHRTSNIQCAKWTLNWLLYFVLVIVNYTWRMETGICYWSTVDVQWHPQSKHRAFTRFKNWFSFLGIKWTYRYCFLLKYPWLLPSKLSIKLCIDWRIRSENSVYMYIFTLWQWLLNYGSPSCRSAMGCEYLADKENVTLC